MAPKADGEVVAQLKAKVALAALRGDQSTAELARQFNVEPAQIERWKSLLVQHAPAVFLLPEAASEPPAATVRRPPPTLHKVPTLGHPTVPQWPERPKVVGALRAVPPPVSGHDDPHDDLWDEDLVTQARHGQTAKAHLRSTDGHLPASAAEGRRGHAATWRRRLLGRLMVGWRERRHAARVARQMLNLYRKVAAEQPGMRKAELYRYVIAARLGGSLPAADAVLEEAAQSFAQWPVARALTFRDVVHYVAVSDYLATNDDIAHWTRDNLGRTVASLVPDHL